MARHKKSPELPLKATDETGGAFDSVQGRMRNLASTAAILEGPLGKFAGRISAVGAAVGRMNPLLLAASVATAALSVAVVKGTNEYADYEQQMFRINALLETTQGVAGVTAEQIDKISKSLGRNTLASQQGARDAAAALIRFTNVQNENFEKTLKLGQDVSAVFGGDLRANVIKIARALDNPAKGLESLERNILTADDAWKKYVIDAFEAGRVSEAQEAILKRLANTIGGAGEGEAQGVKGAIDSAGEAWTDFILKLEASESVTGFFNFITSALDKTREKLLTEETATDRLNDALARLTRTTAFFNATRNDGVSPRILAGRRKFVQAAMDEIAVLKQTVSSEEELKGFRVEGIKGKQWLAKLNADIASDERERFATLLEDDAAQIQIDKENIRRKEAIRVSAEAIWLAAQPPLAQLKAQYQIDVENLELAIKNKEGNVARFRDALILRDAKFQNDKRNLGQKGVKTTARADQISEQLQRDEQRIEASYVRRSLIVVDAITSLGDTQIEKQVQLQNTLKALQEEFERDTLRVKVGYAIDYTRAAASAADTVSDYFLDKSRRLTRATNTEYQDRADKIRENVKLGVTTVADGDKKLAALENARQQQLNRTARVQFERGKKLSRQAAIANTAAAAVGAMADTNGNLYVRLAAAAAIGLAGAAQVARINATTFDGGGSVGASVGAGASVAPVQSAPSAPQVNQSLLIVGNDSTTFSLSQLVSLIQQINQIGSKLDLTLIDPSSRNARDIRDASNSLVI